MKQTFGTESWHISVCPYMTRWHVIPIIPCHLTVSQNVLVPFSEQPGWECFLVSVAEATLCWEQAELSCVHASAALTPFLRAEEWASTAPFGNIALYNVSISGSIPISSVSLCIGSASHINLEWLGLEQNYISVLLTKHPLWNWGWLCCLCWAIPDLMLEWSWQMIPCMPWSMLIQK